MGDSFEQQTGSEELFDVKLNADGKLYIRKFASLVRKSIFLSIVFAAITLTINIIRFIKDDLSVLKGDSLMVWINRVYPYYTFLYVCLFLMSIYYYWRIGQLLRKGMDYTDDKSFNESFRALYQSTVFGVMGFILAIIMGSLDLIWTIKFYL